MKPVTENVSCQNFISVGIISKKMFVHINTVLNVVVIKTASPLLYQKIKKIFSFQQLLFYPGHCLHQKADQTIIYLVNLNLIYINLVNLNFKVFIPLSLQIRYMLNTVSRKRMNEIVKNIIAYQFLFLKDKTYPWSYPYSAEGHHWLGFLMLGSGRICP